MPISCLNWFFELIALFEILTILSEFLSNSSSVKIFVFLIFDYFMGFNYFLCLCSISLKSKDWFQSLLGHKTKISWYSSLLPSGDLLNLTIFWFLIRTDWLMFSSGLKEFLASWTGGKQGLEDLLENVTSFRLILLYTPIFPIESLIVSKYF